MSDALSPFRAALGDPLAAAKTHGRTVAVMGAVPVELIWASGAFPLQIQPRSGPTPLADRYMEGLFDPMVRSAFQQLLSGELDFCEAVVLPRSNDSLQRTYYYLRELRRTGLYRGPEPLLYDVQHMPSEVSAAHTRAATRALAEALGGPASASIEASIGLYDCIRRSLSTLMGADRRGSLGGEDALIVREASGLMAPDAYADALQALVADPAQPADASVRVALIGSAHSSPEAHRAIREAGGEVVLELHWRGDDLFGPEIGAAADPLAALADHYRHTFSSRSYPSPVDEYVVAAKAAGVTHAVFVYYAEEEALVWDGPAQRRALEAAGVRCLTLSLQPWPLDEDALARIAAFVGGGAV